MIFIEACSKAQPEEEFAEYCSSYLKRRFNLAQARVLISRSGVLGPRMPKAGAEANLSNMKSILLDRYSGGRRYFYGFYEGINSMAMNKQVDHAINVWGSKC